MVMSTVERQDTVIAPVGIVPVVAATPRRTINPLIPLCCIGLLLFLIAGTIVLALIPVYLKTRDIEPANVQPTQFTLSLALRNGVLPVGSLSVENCAIIQERLRQQAAASNNVSPSVPTTTSCTVTGNSTTAGKRKKRQTIQGNQINIVVMLSSGRCISNQCSRRRANAFIALLLGSGEFTLNLIQSDGSRFDFAAIFITSSVVSLGPTSSTNPSQVLYGITTQNELLRINTLNPEIILSTVKLTGLRAGDLITAIDFRPATGQLYGVSNNQLYVINEDTGASRTIGGALNSTLYSSISSMEFNPALDVLRIVTETQFSLRVNPETGAIINTDSTATNDRGIAVAFSNNVAGTSTSTLFILNRTSDTLFRQNPPSDLAIIQVGSGLGMDVIDTCGFDIVFNGLAVACVNIGGTVSLYLVDVNSGTLSQNLGKTSQTILSLAFPTASVAYAIRTNDNSLLVINSIASQLSFTSKSISGLANSETILGLDMRPNNGQLYALGSTSRLYTLNLGSGAATVVGSGTIFTPLLSGTIFGFDFNPTVDRIRVVSNSGQNLRLNPNNGAVAGQDTNLNPGSPIITAVAYTNNTANATSTILYDIDSSSNRLLIQIAPNNGTLVDVGSLGIDVDDNNGFDIGGKSGTAVALLTVNGVTSVYQINLKTGAATSVSNTVFPAAVRAYALGLNV